MEKYNITDLDTNEVNLIFAGLQELPAKMSMQLILKLKKQLDPQIPPQYQTPMGRSQ